MHQHPILTNKVSMEISNFEVVNRDRFSKIFKFKVGNFNLITISSIENITDFNVASSYPTLFLNIERVICGSVDSFTVGSRNVQDFICFLDPDVKNLFKFCFARFGIVCPDLIANLNIFNANSS